MSASARPIRLHRMKLSGHCHRVELFLSLLRLPYECVEVNLAAGEHRQPAFLALSAAGQVPVIEDGEVTLADSNAILVNLFGRGDDKAPMQARAHGLLQLMERGLSQAEWLAAGRPTLADIAMYSYTRHAPEGGVSLADYPAVRCWLGRVEALPGFVPMPSSAVGLNA